jgi:hypothetical protein
MTRMRFEENDVLADPAGFMHVRHLRLRGTNFEIGRALAETALRLHGFSVERCRGKEDVVRARREFLTREYPVLIERARGVAAALGVDPGDDRYDLTGIPLNTELPGAGCSDVFYPGSATASGHGVLSRNYDFPLCRMADLSGIELSPQERERIRPMMADPYVIEVYPTDGGHAALFLAAFDLLSGTMDGINGAGLVVATNGDETAMAAGFQPDPDAAGLDELQVGRMLLDSCSTARAGAEAYRRMRRYAAFVPCQYLVADRAGRAFTLDRTPGPEAGITESCPEEPTILTNHPVSAQLAHAVSGSAPGVESGTTSFARFDRLATVLLETPRPYADEAIRRINGEVAVGKVVSWIPPERRQAFASSPGLSRTLWHAVYDTDELTLEVSFYLGDKPAAGGGFTERRTPYFRFSLTPGLRA